MVYSQKPARGRVPIHQYFRRIPENSRAGDAFAS